MKVVIAPLSFKSTLTAEEAAQCISEGIARVDNKVMTSLYPLSDGGEGFLDVILKAKKGRRQISKVKGPFGIPIEAEWGILSDAKTAVIEMAGICGLSLIPLHLRNPLDATTYGMGEVIRDAFDKGIRNFLIGLGGSGTNDGGVGIIQALGGKFLDEKGNELAHGGGSLVHLKKIDLSKLDLRVKESSFLVCCDVSNPLIGPEGATRIYSAQKGAGKKELKHLETGLEQLYALIKQEIGVDLNAIPGSGAAGGTCATKRCGRSTGRRFWRAIAAR